MESMEVCSGESGDKMDILVYAGECGKTLIYVQGECTNLLYGLTPGETCIIDNNSYILN